MTALDAAGLDPRTYAALFRAGYHSPRLPRRVRLERARETARLREVGAPGCGRRTALSTSSTATP